MLLLVHLLLHAALGLLLGATSTSPNSAAGPAASRLAYVGVYLDLGSLAPLVAYELRLWPAYVLGYAFDPLLYPDLYAFVPALCLATLLVLPAALAAAVRGAAELARRGQRGLPVAFAVLTAGVAICALYVLRDDWLTIADFGTFWRGGGTPIYTHLHAAMLAGAYLSALFAVLLSARYH